MHYPECCSALELDCDGHWSEWSLAWRLDCYSVTGLLLGEWIAPRRRRPSEAATATQRGSDGDPATATLRGDPATAMTEDKKRGREARVLLQGLLLSSMVESKVEVWNRGREEQRKKARAPDSPRVKERKKARAVC
ncbi:uncharacterized protein DS421_17g571730 [Arachis hypogaea]|nr:uncharacterized protein DS421_17g571730 [Arachis hypogaea]